MTADRAGFVHDSPAQRVRFGGEGWSSHLRAELAERATQRVMLIASPRTLAAHAGQVAEVPIALRWTDVAQHVPLETAEAARAAAASGGADVVVAFGGGSAVGLAKAVALTTGLPVVAIPTTYAGSEATRMWGITENRRKVTGVDARVLPETVVYDPALVRDLPRPLAVASAFNAMAHCIDSLWAPRADPLNAASAVEGLRRVAEGLRDLNGGHDPGAYGRLQLGAYLAARAFDSAGSGLHHKICHVLGGTYGLPHAQTHAVVLPQVTAFNLAAAPDAAERVARALGSSDALMALDALFAETGAPRALRDLGFRLDDVSDAARIIRDQVPASNPRPVAPADLELLLERAWAGTSVVLDPFA